MNDLSSEVRGAIAKAEVLALAAKSSTQQEALQREINRAKEALKDYTPSSDEQLTTIKQYLEQMLQN